MRKTTEPNSTKIVEDQRNSANELTPFEPSSMELKRILKETHDTFTLELEPGSGSLFRFTPGQFNMLYVFGLGECAISISGPPYEPERLCHTIRRVGAATRALTELKEGDRLDVRGPFGRSWPLVLAKGCDLVLVAGGIGLAPLRPALYQILHRRKEFGKVYLLYGARKPEDLLFTKELEQWQTQSKVEIRTTVDHASSPWKGHVGVVTTQISELHLRASNTLAFVCGPEIMMRFTIMALQQLGLDDRHIFLAMERNMKCGVGLCGHCQLGPLFLCKDGPVVRYDKVQPWFGFGDV